MPTLKAKAAAQPDGHWDTSWRTFKATVPLTVYDQIRLVKAVLARIDGHEPSDQRVVEALCMAFLLEEGNMAVARALLGEVRR